MYQDLINDIQAAADPAKGAFLKRFFKTEKGEYGEGDIFLGIRVPVQRTIAIKYKSLPLQDIERLLQSPIHEHRLIAFFILIMQYGKADGQKRKMIIDLYLTNLSAVNNWDLVDCSAPSLLGDYLLERDKKLLYTFAQSNDLWKKRIGILSTYSFIRKGEFKDALAIATILVNDKHDLIQKAVGWMLREIGNRDINEEKKFLDIYHKTMPRTMLRYAIEKFSLKDRNYYMGR